MTVSKTTTQDEIRNLLTPGAGGGVCGDYYEVVERLAKFCDSLISELQKENAETAKALGIHFCPELEEPWEVPMESEPDYFETLPKAAAFVYTLLDKGLSDREKENARLREALQFIHDTFKRDEDDGYSSRDRQFAIDITKAALAGWHSQDAKPPKGGEVQVAALSKEKE